MINDWWDRPVRVLIKPNLAYTVASSRKAAEILLNEWPTKTGRGHLAARKAVLRSMEHVEDEGARSDAIAAFEAAAREADILLER